MADLKEMGIDVSFKKDFFYKCIEGMCKSFAESYKSYKETHNEFDEVELLHYIGELKRATEDFEEEGAKEDEKLREYYKKRKERNGY